MSLNKHKFEQAQAHEEINTSGPRKEDEILLDDDEKSSFSIIEDGHNLFNDDSNDTEYGKFGYEILSMEQIIHRMKINIDQISAIINIEPTFTRILLHHCGWDMEKLLERYFTEDKEKLFSEANIINPDKRRNLQFGFSQTCEICFGESLEVTGLACGHVYCNNCWDKYLTIKIMDEGIGQTISCPSHECNVVVDDQTVVKLVSDDNVKCRYQRLIMNSFVEGSRLLRWCTQPRCNNVIKGEYVGMEPVTCQCGHKFCFACSENWHNPINCHLLKKWKKKCNEDCETAEWITNNTKECPKCYTSIEKDGGCNHMTCRNQNCRADFCWICLDFWSSHDSSMYKCNRYTEDPKYKGTYADLRKYSFYCTRYMNHLKSLQLQSELYASIKARFEKLHPFSIFILEMPFLKQAIDALLQCRRTLMYTYVFTYYVKSNNQLNLFLDNQRDLETSVEMLSQCLEQFTKKENVLSMKVNLRDKYVYCESRSETLLRHIQEGYEKKWWEFVD